MFDAVDWRDSLLEGAITTAVMMALAGWWSVSRHLKPREPRVLHHTRVLLVLGVLTIAAFSGIAALITLESKGPVEAWVYMIFLGFCGFGVYVIAEYFIVRHELDDHGMHYTTVLSGSGRLSWVDLRRVEYSKVPKWFRLETHMGKTVRVSAMLVGLPEFARLCLTRTNPGVIDNQTREVLNEASIGNLPSVF